MDKPCRARSYHAAGMRLVASSGFIDPSKPRVTILASMGNVVSFGLIIPSRRAPLPPFIYSLTSFRDLDAAAANVRFGRHVQRKTIYLKKIVNLSEALNDERTRTEAAECIRELNEEIRLVPEKGKVRIELFGKLEPAFFAP